MLRSDKCSRPSRMYVAVSWTTMQLPLSAGLMTMSVCLLSPLSAARSGLERFLRTCVHRLGVSVDMASM